MVSSQNKFVQIMKKTFIFMLFLFSCSEKTNKPPSNLIEKETFTKLIIEFQLVQSLVNTYSDTLLAIQLRDSILSKYNVTLNQFYDSELWYHHNIEEYQVILNNAMDILSEEQTKILNEKTPAKTDEPVLNTSERSRPTRKDKNN
jgi:hypothetical protein